MYALEYFNNGGGVWCQLNKSESYFFGQTPPALTDA